MTYDYVAQYWVNEDKSTLKEQTFNNRRDAERWINRKVDLLTKNIGTRIDYRIMVVFSWGYEKK